MMVVLFMWVLRSFMILRCVFIAHMVRLASCIFFAISPDRGHWQEAPTSILWEYEGCCSDCCAGCQIQPESQTNCSEHGSEDVATSNDQNR